jgi:predicted nuclease of predicted toxin-antitoxin system
LPPDQPTFFIDRSLGRHIVATALRQAGLEVEVHDDHFPPDAKDQEWLSEVGVRGWVVLTKDKRIKHRLLEMNAVLSARARVFTLTAGDLQGQEMASIFLRALPKIQRYIAANAAPFIARVTKSGSVSTAFPD